MAFLRKREQKELNLPSLIDVVFLLLIYSLLTIPIEKSETSTANPADAKSRQEVNLPFVKSRKVVEIDPIPDFLVQIDNENPQDPGSGRSSPSSNLQRRTRRWGRRWKRPAGFGLRRFPADFLALSEREFSQTRACRLIRDEIRRFERGRLPRKDVSKRIEIRAVKNTEFRIVNAILRECSAFGDTLPAVAVRTLSNAQ
jgi:hypothetical protein